MSRLGVVTGLELEAWVLRRSLAGTALVATAGGNHGAAEAAATTLIANGARALASLGVAGGLAPGLAPGVAVLAAQVAMLGGNDLDSDPAWLSRVAIGLKERGLPVAIGRLVTVAAPVLTSAAKTALGAARQAVAVDMESAPVAAVAAARGVPFLAVRVIADGAGRNVPDQLAALVSGAGRVSPVRALSVLAAAPALVGPTFRLAWDFVCALRTLGRVAPIVAGASRTLG